MNDETVANEIIGAGVLDNATSISGVGVIDGTYGALSLNNEQGAVIDADGAHALTITNALGLFNITNDGVMEATGAGGLVLSSCAINNDASGQIEANGGSVVVNNSTTITVGALTASNGGAFQIAGFVTLDSVANQALSVSAVVGDELGTGGGGNRDRRRGRGGA
jgi:hypothetical protein